MAIYRPCPNRISCPATILLPGMGVVEDPDSPLMNLSSEAPDPINFIGINYEQFIPQPDDPWQWWQDTGGYGGNTTGTNQNNANDNARNQNQDNAVGGDQSNPETPPGGPVRPTPTLYENEVQTCGVPCSGGGTYEYTVPAGTVRSAISQEEANARAASICETRAGINPLCFITDTLPGACKDDAYSEYVQVGGGSPFVDQVPPYSYLFSIIDGSLPTDLVLDVYTGEIYGSPSATGNFTFTVRAVDAVFNVVDKQFNIAVLGITTDELEGATSGTAYSDTLVGDLPPGYTGVWSITGGALPGNLVLDPNTGVISGSNPGTKGDHYFQVTFTATST